MASGRQRREIEAAATVIARREILTIPAPSGFAPVSHTHSSSAITNFAESVDDRVAALLVAGTNVTLTYNDVAGTLTIAASGGGSGGTSLDDALALQDLL